MILLSTSSEEGPGGGVFMILRILGLGNILLAKTRRRGLQYHLGMYDGLYQRSSCVSEYLLMHSFLKDMVTPGQFDSPLLR